jgi:LysM repeat protein
MDTISRENNGSYLPVAGVIVGLLALVLSAVALVKVSSTKKLVDEQAAKVAEIDSVKGQLGSVQATADKAGRDIVSLTRSTQDAITQIGQMIGEANAKIGKMEESAKKPAVAEKGAKGGAKEPAVAGPDEYVIKSGDTLAKVAKARGFSLSDIQAVNPGVNAKDLKVGQKIKLPAKK